MTAFAIHAMYRLWVYKFEEEKNLGVRKTNLQLHSEGASPNPFFLARLMLIVEWISGNVVIASLVIINRQLQIPQAHALFSLLQLSLH